MRGFGAFATANTLLLINGRRVNDVDLQGVDFSTIPRQFDRAHRNHARQQRRGALRRQRRRRRHQHHHQDRRRRTGVSLGASKAASGRSTRASARLLSRHNSGPWSSSSSQTGSPRTAIASTTTSGRKTASARSATLRQTSQRSSTCPATISISDFPAPVTTSRRPSFRTRLPRTYQRPAGHQFSVRLWQSARRQRDRRLYQDSGEWRRAHR